MNAMRLLAALILILVSFGAAAPAFAQRAPDPQTWRPLDPENTLYIDTTKGRIVLELYPEIAPLHVERVKTLARMQFYDGLSFHRVIDNFMAQGGDPMGTGAGGSPLPDLPPEFSYRRGPEMPFIGAVTQTNALFGFFKTLPIMTQPDMQMEINEDGRVRAQGLHCPGVASMARLSEEDTANSQFFLMRQAYPTLDGRYSIWGRVVYGLDVVRNLSVGTPPSSMDRMTQVRVAADLPASERAPIYVMRTDSRGFRDVIEETRRDRRADFSICDVEIPVRVPRPESEERNWWSFIPFLN